MSGLLFLIGMWLQVPTTTASKRHKQTMLRPNLSEKKSLIAGQQQGGFSFQNLMHYLFTNCHRTVHYYSRQGRSGCTKLYQWHPYKIPGPAKVVTLSVSQKWGIIQVTILSNLSMLGKELWYKVLCLPTTMQLYVYACITKVVYIPVVVVSC